MSAPQERSFEEALLPEAWRFEGRQPICFELPGTRRPWNWLALDQGEAAVLWQILEEFVGFLNHRYVERAEQRVPPCWAEHGALVEELTTLYWARWQAFESRDGSVGGAQFFHSQTLPGFLDRMTRWISPDRLRKCQAGRHEPRVLDEPVEASAWEFRRHEIAAADLALRQPARQRADDAPQAPQDLAASPTPARRSAARLGYANPDVESPPEGDGTGGGEPGPTQPPGNGGSPA